MKDNDKASVFDGPTSEFVIDGCLSVPAGMTEDEMFDEFIAWVESKGYAFGGTLHEFKEEDELPFGPVTRVDDESPEQEKMLAELSNPLPIDPDEEKLLSEENKEDKYI